MGCTRRVSGRMVVRGTHAPLWQVGLGVCVWPRSGGWEAGFVGLMGYWWWWWCWWKAGNMWRRRGWWRRQPSSTVTDLRCDTEVPASGSSLRAPFLSSGSSQATVVASIDGTRARRRWRHLSRQSLTTTTRRFGDDEGTVVTQQRLPLPLALAQFSLPP
nr:uncharacterized protein LOC112695868 [Arachis hypogaea]